MYSEDNYESLIVSDNQEIYFSIKITSEKLSIFIHIFRIIKKFEFFLRLTDGSSKSIFSTKYNCCIK